MRFIITVRRTIDYKSMTKDKFCGQLFVGQDRLEKIYGFIKIWDQLFKVKYFEFRHILKSIAASNWIVLPKLHAIVINSLPNLNDGDVVLLVDDDDWFNPALAQIDAVGDAIKWYRRQKN